MIATAAPQYTTSVLCSPGEIAYLADACERCRLAHTRRPRVEQRLDWEPIRPGGTRVVVLQDARELVGYARVSVGPWDLRWDARLPGGRRPVARFPLLSAEYCSDDLVAPENPEARAALLAGLLDACSDCHVIRLSWLAEDSDMWRLVQSSSRQRRGRWVFLSSPPTPRWLARIPSDFDQYMAKFSRKTRHNLRREQRRLAGVFETVAELRVVTDREELCDFMAQAVAIADRSALAHAISGQLRSDGFVRRLERLADLGWLRCYALVGDGQPIAFAIGWTVDGVCCLHRAAFDNRWLPYSPGKALIYRIIESLCADQDVEWLDFMHYHWDYKQFFATDMYTELSAYLIRFEPRTAMAFAPFFFFRSAKQALDAGLALAGVHRKVSRQLRRPGHKSPSDQGAAP